MRDLAIPFLKDVKDVVFKLNHLFIMNLLRNYLTLILVNVARNIIFFIIFIKKSRKIIFVMIMRSVKKNISNFRCC